MSYKPSLDYYRVRRSSDCAVRLDYITWSMGEISSLLQVWPAVISHQCQKCRGLGGCCLRKVVINRYQPWIPTGCTRPRAIGTASTSWPPSPPYLMSIYIDHTGAFASFWNREFPGVPCPPVPKKEWVSPFFSFFIFRDLGSHSTVPGLRDLFFFVFFFSRNKFNSCLNSP